MFTFPTFTHKLTQRTKDNEYEPFSAIQSCTVNVLKGRFTPKFIHQLCPLMVCTTHPWLCRVLQPDSTQFKEKRLILSLNVALIVNVSPASERNRPKTATCF